MQDSLCYIWYNELLARVHKPQSDSIVHFEMPTFQLSYNRMQFANAQQPTWRVGIQKSTTNMTLVACETWDREVTHSEPWRGDCQWYFMMFFPVLENISNPEISKGTSLKIWPYKKCTAGLAANGKHTSYGVRKCDHSRSAEWGWVARWKRLSNSKAYRPSSTLSAVILFYSFIHKGWKVWLVKLTAKSSWP